MEDPCISLVPYGPTHKHNQGGHCAFMLDVAFGHVDPSLLGRALQRMLLHSRRVLDDLQTMKRIRASMHGAKVNNTVESSNRPRYGRQLSSVQPFHTPSATSGNVDPSRLG